MSDRVLLGQSRVLLTGLRNPQAYAAGGSLYVAQELTPRADAAKEVISELMRVDPVSGRVLATRRLGSEFGQALIAAGELWVITYSFTGRRRASYSVLGLDPHSLAVRSRTILPGTGRSNTLGSLAVAGHSLWVGTGTLDRVSLASGRVDRNVKLHYRGPVQVAADPTGRVLLASLGSEHPTYIARLNPRTGALRARTTVPWSVSQPSIDGIVAGGAWIGNSTGMTTTSWRIDLQTLKTTPTQVPAIPGSRVFASAIDGILWVTKPERGQLVTYCADRVTGARLARLPGLGTNSMLLTARATSIYYSDVSLKTGSIVLKRAPIDPRCSSYTAASTAGRDRTDARLAHARPICRTSHLKIIMGHSFAGLGTAGANIRFINHASESCELHGWPTLIAETAAPGSAHAAAQDWPGTQFADVSQVGVPTVILRPDERADAIFEAADGSPSGRPCGPAYRTLRVKPPGNTKSVTISARIPWLGRFLPSCSQIRLSPVLASTAVYKG